MSGFIARLTEVQIPAQTLSNCPIFLGTVALLFSACQWLMVLTSNLCSEINKVLDRRLPVCVWYILEVTKKQLPVLLLLSIIITGASFVAQMVKNLPVTQETQVQSLGWEDPLEKEMAKIGRAHV